MTRLSHLRRLFLLLIVVAVAVSTRLSSAQAAIETVDITTVDYSAFPDIALQVRVLDGLGSLVNLGDGDLMVTENGQPVTIRRRDRVTAGIQVAIVIDGGAGIDARGLDGPTDSTRLQIMQAAATDFVDGMGDQDAAEVVVISPNGISVPQPLTSDKDLLRKVIDGLELETIYAQTVDDKGNVINHLQFSHGLTGVDQALTDLKSTDGVRARAVLLFSSGIQRGFADYDKIEQMAREIRSPIHVVGVGRSDWGGTLARLADNTHGRATFYDNRTSLDAVYAELDTQRDQYLLTFRTRESSQGERIVEVRANSGTSSERTDTFRFTVQPVPVAPEVHSILVNDGAPVRRQAATSGTDPAGILPTEVEVTAELFWPDGYPRQVALAELLVDGQPHGAAQTNPGSDLSFTWDVRSFTAEGDSTARIQIRVQDELGFAATSEPIAASVEVVLAPPCQGLSGWRLWLCSGRDWLVAVPGMLALALAVPALIIAVVVFQNRGKIGSAIESAKKTVTDLLPGARGKPAKAYLHLLDGATESGRRQLKLYGTTPIGRDSRNVGKDGLLLHQGKAYSPISTLQCNIVEEEAGQFSIRDEGSTNGTFVNRERVMADPRPLHEGDIIELAEVERGGVRFRFSFNPSTDHSGESTVVESVKTDLTR